MSTIKEYGSLSSLGEEECLVLCENLRQRLVEVTSKTGGHVSSNLGVVEVTVALHRVFDTSIDRLVFDVGHQSYIHKMLTGRNGRMESIRSFGGLAGFPKPSESPHDAFVAGHASNAVSVAVGMAMARTAKGADYHVIALMGDGALSGGLAYEGLSTAGQSGENMIIILNDNGMSITKNVSAMGKHLAKQRLKPQYFKAKERYRAFMNCTAFGRGFYKVTRRMKDGIKASMLPSGMFEEMGLRYMGPVDGHNVRELTRVLEQAKTMEGPVLVHVKTTKGKGYMPAEEKPDSFHGIAPYYLESGQAKNPTTGMNFSAVFGETLCELARENKTILGITAAMESGTGLTKFAKEFPSQYFDVGIAEGGGVSLAGGLAKEGMLPVFAVYATFLPRAYDMLIHDISMLDLHAIFCVDRAGLVGDDGETHHGVFDVAFLHTVPHMQVFCPSNYGELKAMLHRAVKELSGPIAIRYPRGVEGDFTRDTSGEKEVLLQKGVSVTLVTYGQMINVGKAVLESLKSKGIFVELIKLNQICPLDGTKIEASVRKTKKLVVLEDVIAMGSVGERLLSHLAVSGIALDKAALCNLGEGFVPHGNVEKLHEICGIDAMSVAKKVEEVWTYGD